MMQRRSVEQIRAAWNANEPMGAVDVVDLLEAYDALTKATNISSQKNVETWELPHPKGWRIVQQWGEGLAFAEVNGGLRVIIDCGEKADGHQWIHVSYSRKDWPPNHADTCKVKAAFLGDRYAYAVFPPPDKYVNIHPNCLHLWARLDGAPVLPEFSEIVDGVGRSI